MELRRKQHGPEVFRITGARQGLAEDVRGRERRYVFSMLVRTVSVLLTVVLWNVQRPLAVVMLVLGAVLPYVAVVIANAGRENAPGLPDSHLPAPPRNALGPAGGAREPGDGVAAPGARTIRQDLRDPDGAGPEPDAEAAGPEHGAEGARPGHRHRI